jgi:hypothetical protein
VVAVGCLASFIGTIRQWAADGKMGMNIPLPLGAGGSATGMEVLANAPSLLGVFNFLIRILNFTKNSAKIEALKSRIFIGKFGR